MHPNPVFHTGDEDANLKFARDRGFGVLAVAVDGAPMLSHVPFLLSKDGDVAELHLVRSNPIARALGAPMSARIAVSGPDGYVSPDWYGVPDQVPTWNYVAVHLTGRLERLPDEALLDLLDRQSALFEARLTTKAPWTTDKMNSEALRKMMRMIVPCRMVIEDVQGTWKMSQNKPDEVRLAAAEQMEATGFGAEVSDLARAMREV